MISSILGVNPIWGLVKEAVMWLLANIFVINFVVFTIPFVILQNIVFRVAQVLDKDITRVVTGLSAIFHRDFDKLYTDKPLHTIVACLRIKGGSLSKPVLEEYLMRNVIKKKNSEGKLAYPELQQYFKRFFGYSFLKWDRKFDIKKHVSVYQKREERMVMNKEELMNVWEELITKRFVEGQSPWEAVLIDNYVAEDNEENGADWVVFVRLHHGLADGFSFEKILSSLFESDFTPKGGKGNEGKVEDLVQDMMEKIRCAAMGPYDLVNKGIRNAEDYNSLHFPAEVKANEYFIVESGLIGVDEVKKVKKKLGVGFTTVLLTVATGGVKRFLEMTGTPVPERYTATIPFPAGARKEDKLENKFYLASLELPISLNSQKDRLTKVHQELLNLRHSSFMMMMDFYLNRMSCLPSVLLRAATKKSIFSISYSSIPGPEKIITGGFGGECSLVEANFAHGLSPDSLGLAISTLTFAGKLRMTLFVDRNLMGGRRDKANIFVDCLMEEWRELQKCALRE